MKLDEELTRIIEESDLKVDENRNLYRKVSESDFNLLYRAIYEKQCHLDHYKKVGIGLVAGSLIGFITIGISLL